MDKQQEGGRRSGAVRKLIGEGGKRIGKEMRVSKI